MHLNYERLSSAGAFNLLFASQFRLSPNLILRVYPLPTGYTGLPSTQSRTGPSDLVFPSTNIFNGRFVYFTNTAFKVIQPDTDLYSISLPGEEYKLKLVLQYLKTNAPVLVKMRQGKLLQLDES